MGDGEKIIGNSRPVAVIQGILSETDTSQTAKKQNSQEGKEYTYW